MCFNAFTLSPSELYGASWQDTDRKHPSMTRLRIQLFGEFLFEYDGRDLLSGRRSTRAALLIGYLVLHRGKRQRRDTLAFLFWPDSTEPQARTNLRSLLSSLRKRVPDLASCLYDDETFLCWYVDEHQQIDVADFEETLQRAAQANHTDQETNIDLLTHAVMQYAGQLLPGVYEEWVLSERQRLHTAYLDALVWLVELLATLGRSREAIRYAELLLQADPLRETSYLLLMRLHATVGDRAQALAVFAQCNKVLVEELGVEPGPAVQELYLRLLNIEQPTNSTPPIHVPRSHMVGRSVQWEQLLTIWHAAYNGRAQVVLLTGEAGIGKTHFVRELVRWCNDHGIVALEASCPQATEPLPFATLAGWLASEKLAHRFGRLHDDDLANLLILSPALRRRYAHLPAMPTLTLEWQRLRLMQALTTLLADETEPTLLFVDDAQWCDVRLVEWLKYVFAGHPTARLLVVVAMNSGAQSDNPLSQAKNSFLAQGKLTQIELQGLTFDETRCLALEAAGSIIDAQTLDRLCVAAAGVPFFVVEFVRTLQARQTRTESSTHAGLEVPIPVPDTVTALILNQLTGLSRSARHLLDVAAVCGKRFSVTLVAQIDQLDVEERVQALEELWRRVLIIRVDSGYEFSHELVQYVIYQQISEPRRSHLHAKIAAATESSVSIRSDWVSLQGKSASAEEPLGH